MSSTASKRSSQAQKSERNSARQPEANRSKAPTGLQASLQALQQTAGNRAVGDLLQQNAKRLMASAGGMPPLVQSALSSGGRPLTPQTRAEMEAHFKHDFSQVRVHTNELAADSAQALLARAYTVGRDVVFGRGRYAPETFEGKRLLAHELAHVVQQTPGIRARGSLSDPEGEAALAGRAAASGQTAAVSSTVSTGIQREPLTADEQKEVEEIHNQLNFGINDAKKTAKLRARLVELASKQAGSTNDKAHDPPPDKKKSDKPDFGPPMSDDAVRNFVAANQANKAKQDKAPNDRSHPSKMPAKKGKLDLGTPDMDAMRKYATDAQQQGKKTPPQAHATPYIPKTRPGKDEWHTQEMKDSMPPMSMADIERFNQADKRRKRIEEEKRLYGFVISPDLYDPKPAKPNIPPPKAGERTQDLKVLGTVLLPANVEGVRRVWVVNLTAEFKRLRGDADSRYYYAKQFLSEWTIIRKPADWVSGARPPDLAIWMDVLSLCDQGEAAIKNGKLEDAYQLLQTGNKRFENALSNWRKYIDKNMSGAEKIKTGAEYTKKAADLTLLALAIVASGGGALAVRGGITTIEAATAASRIATWTPVAQELAENAAKLIVGDKVDWAKLPLDMATALISSKLKLGDKLIGGIFGNVLKNPVAEKFGQEAIKRFVISLVNQHADILIRNYLEGIWGNLMGKDIPLSQVLQQTWDQITDPEGALTRLVISGMHGALGGKAKPDEPPDKSTPAAPAAAAQAQGKPAGQGTPGQPAANTQVQPQPKPAAPPGAPTKTTPTRAAGDKKSPSRPPAPAAAAAGKADAQDQAAGQAATKAQQGNVPPPAPAPAPANAGAQAGQPAQKKPAGQPPGQDQPQQRAATPWTPSPQDLPPSPVGNDTTAWWNKNRQSKPQVQAKPLQKASGGGEHVYGAEDAQTGDATKASAASGKPSRGADVVQMAGRGSTSAGKTDAPPVAAKPAPPPKKAQRKAGKGSVQEDETPAKVNKTPAKADEPAADDVAAPGAAKKAAPAALKSAATTGKPSKAAPAKTGTTATPKPAAKTTTKSTAKTATKSAAKTTGKTTAKPKTKTKTPAARTKKLSPDEQRTQDVLDEFGERQGEATARESQRKELTKQPDIEDTRRKVGKNQSKRTERGIDVHQYSDALDGWVNKRMANADPKITGKLFPKGAPPPTSEAEVNILDPDRGRMYRMDRVDWENGIIYEIKSNAPGQQGTGQTKLDNVYKPLMDKKYPRPGGWKTEVIIYDRAVAEQILYGD